MAQQTGGGAVRRVAHRAIDKAITVFTPADGSTPYRPVEPANLALTPEQLFAFDGQAPEISIEKVRRVRLGGPDVLRRRFSFQSRCRLGIADNDIVRGYWLAPLERSTQASLILLHGWKSLGLGQLQRVARHAIREGVEVFIPAHPFHAWRRPKLTSSGLLMLTPDLDRSLRAVRQAVLDVRCLLSWIQQRAQGPLLLAGVDLGGLIAALTATVHEDLDGLVLIAAPDRLSELLWSGHTDKGKFREALERAGIDRQTVDTAWASLDPGWHAPLLDPANILLVEGRYDATDCGTCFERLCDRWGTASLEVSRHGFARTDFPYFAKPIIREALELVEVG